MRHIPVPNLESDQICNSRAFHPNRQFNLFHVVIYGRLYDVNALLHFCVWYWRHSSVTVHATTKMAAYIQDFNRETNAEQRNCSVETNYSRCYKNCNLKDTASSTQITSISQDFEHEFTYLLYGTTAEESRLRVFENRILRRIFGPKRDENGEWRRLHNEELHSLYRLYSW